MALFDDPEDELCTAEQTRRQKDLKAQNRRFMGLSKLKKTKWWPRPRSNQPRFKNVPTVASSQAELRAAELEVNRVWRSEYAETEDKRDRGEPFVYPHGAFLLPKVYGFAVSPAPSAAIAEVRTGVNKPPELDRKIER